jgi:CcmD family protein
MPDFLRDPAFAIYVALAVALVVWIGIFAFLWRLDRQTRALRRQLEDAPPAPAPAPRATIERTAHVTTKSE